MDADGKKADDRYDSDEEARTFFTPADLALSPEEYAARHAHRWGCFSLHFRRYRDPALGAWVRRLGEIFFTRGEVERCRKAYLSPQELDRVRREQQEPF